MVEGVTMLEKRKILTIGDSSCTGCGACYNKCPVSAIEMLENREGFLIPQIDSEKCVNCGLCDTCCPVLNEEKRTEYIPQIYAANAEDEIRKKSSSGGIFTVLAEKVLEHSGYVCGASFTEDFFGVEHIIVDSLEGLEKLRGSKYSQSSIGKSFKEIKDLLESNKEVLFSGCPCQVAGLKSFLGKEYDNLKTIDLVCHGIPSPKAYRKFLETEILKDNKDNKLKEFSFRKKEAWGWSHSVYAVLDNGYTISKAKTQTSWYTSFLNLLNCRKSCGDCKFNKIPRQGDITLGDFWAIENLTPDWNDRKGTSIVSINSEKGKRFFETVLEKLPKKEITTIEKAKEKNGNLLASSRSHKFRYRFFDLLNKYDDYGKVTEYSLKRKFDIGYIGWWYGQNYGSVLTNYALHEYLQSLNYSVLMLEWPEHQKPTWPISNSFARRFANKHYEISMRRTYDELPELNWFCDMFVVGSDQLWNYWSTKENGFYFFLDFVEDSKKKIAYATSFGHPTYGAPSYISKDAAFHMQRIDYVSVREKDGIDICRNTFGVNAVQNIDPVFLCSQERYLELIKESKVKEDKKFIFAYILSPTEEKRKTILEVAEKTGLSVVLVLDAQADFEKNSAVMNMPESLKTNLELEDWLYYVANSELVLTDSYHGLCFSIIFRKKFVCFANVMRGISRFVTLLEIANLMNRMVYEPSECITKELYNAEIDYEKAWALLDNSIEKSKNWLKEALASEKTNKSSVYDILLRKIFELERKIDEKSK